MAGGTIGNSFTQYQVAKIKTTTAQDPGRLCTAKHPYLIRDLIHKAKDEHVRLRPYRQGHRLHQPAC